MDSEKIIQDLNRRFAEPLPEYYRRRIIVWHDEEKEFQNRLDEIVLDNAKIIALTGTNNFVVKKQISIDDVTSNILLYDPCTYASDDDNWLLDVEKYSEEFRADIVAMWMEEMKLDPSLRLCVKRYQKFFNAKPRRDKIAKMEKLPQSSKTLSYAVMAAVAGVNDTRPEMILRAVLCEGIEIEKNAIYRDFIAYQIEDAFWEMVYPRTGYQANPTSYSLEDLWKHIVIASFSKNYVNDLPQKWNIIVSDRNKSFCYDFINEWIHSNEVDTLKRYLLRFEKENDVSAYLSKQPSNDIVGVECFVCTHEVLLVKLMTSIANEIIDVTKIRSIIDKRRVMAWYEDYHNIYEGLLQLANIQEFYLEHVSGFHCSQAKELWKAYTDDLYRCDQYYRKLHRAYEEYLLQFNPVLNDLYKSVIERAERIYNNWFLDGLSSNWTTICHDELSTLGKIEGVHQQIDFYKRKVKTAENRVFVVISDALRYEVAEQLKDELARKQQSKVNISSQQAVFPSITKFGMAALLPNNGLSIVKGSSEVKVKIDDKYTDAPYREEILKRANPDSCVLKYNDIISMRSSDRSELVKGKKVVYIYHDTIDDVCHTNDTGVFEACERTVHQLSNLVDIMVRDFKALNILITADHGFLYTYSDLNETDKMEKADFKNHIVEGGRRFVLMDGDVSPEYLMKVKMQTFSDDIVAFAPKENVRIKNSGGMKFVHGGVSLQELVVPIIEYTHVNVGTREYMRNKERYDTKPVGLSLLSANHSIHNMSFSLDFYQIDPVGSTREAMEYNIYFVDELGTIISDLQRIIADKTSENGQDRVFRTTFNLKSGDYKTSNSYYLVIADDKGLETCRYEFEISVFIDDEDDF